MTEDIRLATAAELEQVSAAVGQNAKASKGAAAGQGAQASEGGGAGAYTSHGGAVGQNAYSMHGAAVGSTSAYIEFAESSKPSGAATAYGYVDYIIES